MFTSAVKATVLFADPQDVTVEANQWAQFNCSVSCDYTSTVGWYMAGYRRAIKRNNTIPGLLVKISSDVMCISTTIKKTHFLEVLATEALNKSTFYCAAYGNTIKRRSAVVVKEGDVIAGLPSCCLGKF